MIIAVQPCDQTFLRNPKRAMELSYWRGADMIELRADFADPADWPKIVAALPDAPCHLVVTCRRTRDGGKYSSDEGQRLDFLRQCAQAGARYVDIESDVENADAIADPPGAIRSFHNMEETNIEEMRQELEKLREQSAFNVKFATKANSLADNLIHREILGEMSGLWLKASFGMGMKGTPSRLLQPFWGGGVVYCAAKGAEEALTELPTQEEVVRIYRMRHWFANKAKMPKLYGLAGSPIRNSLSPTIHNGFFARHKVDAFYIPLESDDADEVAAFARELGFAGLSVTIPLKEKIGPAFGGEAGVFNTVKLDCGEASFANTDIAAFRADLRFLIDDAKLAQSRVLILGAGGAAYAAVEALKHDAGELLITNRTPERAKALAAKTGIGFHPNPIEDENGFDLIVNATPCGAVGSAYENAIPFPLPEAENEEDDPPRFPLIYDMVVGQSAWRPNPSCFTEFVKQAGDSGTIARHNLELGKAQEKVESKLDPRWGFHSYVAGVRDGFGMLVKQAIEQQRVWGERPKDLSYNDMRISLVGFRGAGKSTIGRLLAEHFELPFIDLDNAIEERAGMTIREFFDQHGEAAFRDIEADTLAKAIMAKPAFILATGGGIVERASNMRLLYEHSKVFCLDSAPSKLRETLAKGDRPSLHPEGPEGEVRDIWPRRRERYLAIADAKAGDMTTFQLDQVAQYLAPFIMQLSHNLDAKEADE